MKKPSFIKYQRCYDCGDLFRITELFKIGQHLFCKFCYEILTGKDVD